MDNFAINNIANMERALYGYNSGRDINCPSMYNNYIGGGANFMNYYNPMFNGYGNYSQDIFTQSRNAAGNATSSQSSAQASSQVDWSNPQFKGLSEDLNAIGDYYIKNSAPSESFIGAAVGGAAFGLMNNMRILAHPINAIKALPETAKMFTAIGQEGTALRALWQDPKTTKVVMEAYGQMHKLNGAKYWRAGLFKSQIDAKTVEDVVAKMKSALASGKAEEIAKVSEEARRLTNAKTGYIPRGARAIGLNKPVQWFKNSALGKMLGLDAAKPTVAEAATKSVADKAAASTLSGALKHSCGIGNGLMFALFEGAFDLMDGKIQAAFDKDKATGYKQLGQTAIKGAGSAIGWAVGEGIGTWAGAMAAMKIGALTGSAVAPGVGTAIGAIAGLVGGSIGCWLTGKITHKIIGQEAGTLAKVEKMKQSKEGQVELLTLTAQQAEEDKKLDPRTLQALQNVANYYGAGA